MSKFKFSSTTGFILVLLTTTSACQADVNERIYLECVIDNYWSVGDSGVRRGDERISSTTFIRIDQQNGVMAILDDENRWDNTECTTGHDPDVFASLVATSIDCDLEGNSYTFTLSWDRYISSFFSVDRYSRRILVESRRDGTLFSGADGVCNLIDDPAPSRQRQF